MKKNSNLNRRAVANQTRAAVGQSPRLPTVDDETGVRCRVYSSNG